MKKYAKVIDAKLGTCEVGIGTDDEFYQSIGMELMDVEQGYNGNWYLSGHAPVPPAVKTIRTFAKDAIWVATKDLLLPDGSNAWEAFKQFLESADLKEGWDQQAYLLENNPFFAEFYPRAVTVFGQELVDRVLAASVVEVKTYPVEN